MKTIKSRIVSLCLAIALIFSGAYVTKIHASGIGDSQGPGPQDSSTSPPPQSPPVGSPEHCSYCYLMWLLGF